MINWLKIYDQLKQLCWDVYGWVCELVLVCQHSIYHR